MSAPALRRPWRERVWCWKPEWYFAYYWDPTLSIPRRLLRITVPVGLGGDEWDWHTLVFGWTFTGRIIVATRRCPQTGRCADGEPLRPDWPADPYPEMRESAAPIGA